MRGLAGNYDSNAANDFVTSGGVIDERVVSFGNSWKLGINCADAVSDETKPCQINSQRGWLVDFEPLDIQYSIILNRDHIFL